MLFLNNGAKKHWCQKKAATLLNNGYLCSTATKKFFLRVQHNLHTVTAWQLLHFACTDVQYCHRRTQHGVFEISCGFFDAEQETHNTATKA